MHQVREDTDPCNQTQNVVPAKRSMLAEDCSTVDPQGDGERAQSHEKAIDGKHLMATTGDGDRHCAGQDSSLPSPSQFDDAR